MRVATQVEHLGAQWRQWRKIHVLQVGGVGAEVCDIYSKKRHLDVPVSICF